MSTRTEHQSKTIQRLKEELLCEIKAHMEKEKMTQKEAADSIGTLQNNISRTFSGKEPVRIDYLIRLAEGVGLRVDLRLKKAKG